MIRLLIFTSILLFNSLCSAQTVLSVLGRTNPVITGVLTITNTNGTFVTVETNLIKTTSSNLRFQDATAGNVTLSSLVGGSGSILGDTNPVSLSVNLGNIPNWWNSVYTNSSPRSLACIGDSVAFLKFDQIWPLISDTIGFAGYRFNGGARGAYTLAGGSVLNTGPDATWFRDYFTLTNTGSITWTNANNANGDLVANTAEIYYVAESGGGSFKLQTSTNGAAYTDALTVDATNATTIGVMTNISLGRGLWRLRALGTSGTVKVLGSSLYDTTTNGVLITYLDKSGIALTNIHTVPSAILVPVLSNIAPNLILWEMKDQPNAAFTNGMVALETLWTNALPNSDIIYIGTTISSNDFVASWDYIQNQHVRSVALANKRAYWDGYTPCPPYNVLTNRGWLDSSGIHPTAPLNSLLASKMWNDINQANNFKYSMTDKAGARKFIGTASTSPTFTFIGATNSGIGYAADNQVNVYLASAPYISFVTGATEPTIRGGFGTTLSLQDSSGTNILRGVGNLATWADSVNTTWLHFGEPTARWLITAKNGGAASRAGIMASYFQVSASSTAASSPAPIHRFELIDNLAVLSFWADTPGIFTVGNARVVSNTFSGVFTGTNTTGSNYFGGLLSAANGFQIPGFGATSNYFWRCTNTTTGAGSWSAIGAGSQTPWVSDIDAGGFSLTNLNNVIVTNAAGSNYFGGLLSAANGLQIPGFGATSNYFWRCTNATTGAGSWSAIAAGNQTPWTSDINAGGFSLTNLNNLVSTGTVTFATGYFSNIYVTNITGTATNLASTKSPLLSSVGDGKQIVSDDGTTTDIKAGNVVLHKMSDTVNILYDQSGLQKISVANAGTTVSNAFDVKGGLLSANAGINVSGGGTTNNGTGFYGNGAGLTNLNGANIVGTLTNTVALSSNLVAGITVNAVNLISTTNYQSTNLVANVKAAFSTNYTATLTDSVLACTGTNQVITLPDGTNGVPTGRMFTILCASTNGYGSVIITNANGQQQMLSTALSQTITNGQSLTVLWLPTVTAWR